MRRFVRALARFGPADCRSIFPSVETILARLRSTELNYPEPRRFKWSRPTVFRYLKRLEAAGIASVQGRTSMRGTSRRVLHPERLLSVPREDETFARREDETRSKSLKSKKKQGSRKKQNHPADDAACLSLGSGQKPVNPQSLLSTMIRRAGCGQGIFELFISKCGKTRADDM
jgi:hypothetical protein